jgi:hypothetical protein
MSALSKARISYLMVVIITGILVTTPTIGGHSNASATTTRSDFLDQFTQSEEPQQQGGGGFAPFEETTTNETTTQTPDTTGVTPTPPQPTEPGPTQNQTLVGQNQTETQGPAPLSPAAPSIILNSGNPSLDPSRDSFIECSLDGGVTWQKAYIVPKFSSYGIITGTQWVSCTPNSTTATVDTWYRTNFTLPACFSNASINIQIHADNAATIYLNSPPNKPDTPANQIGAQTLDDIPENFQNPPESYPTTPVNPALFIPGTNIIYFKVHNFGGPTALDYLANVTFTETICPPTTTPPPPLCPAKNVQHWDKIVFSISNPRLAGSLRLPLNTPLDIKVLDNPLTVADIKQKVLTFLKLQANQNNRNAISIIDIEYAIICAEGPSISNVPIEHVPTEEIPVNVTGLQQQQLNGTQELQQQTQQPDNNTTATTGGGTMNNATTTTGANATGTSTTGATTTTNLTTTTTPTTDGDGTGTTNPGTTAAQLP